MNTETLTVEELTEAVKYLRQKVEAMEERFSTHGHNVLADTTGTPIQWTPPRKNPTPADAAELVEKAVRVARKYGASPLPSRLRTT